MNREAGWRSSNGDMWLLPEHYADDEHGIQSTQATRELMQEGEEMNIHEGQMAKAMSIDSEWEIRREIQNEESK